MSWEEYLKYIEQYFVLSDKYQEIRGNLSILEDTLISDLYQNGWAVIDAARYISCLEEINPELDEALAISRMQKLVDKYTK
jgi:hypothetical protein